MIMELLTRTNANPYLPDYSGQTFLEMVEIHIPSYFITFQSCKNSLLTLLITLNSAW